MKGVSFPFLSKSLVLLLSHSLLLAVTSLTLPSIHTQPAKPATSLYRL